MGMGSSGVSPDVVVHHVFRILAGTNETSGGSGGINSNLSAKFNPSMAIIIIVLISAFLFMGFFSIYVRRCTRNNVGSNNDPVRQARDAAAAAAVRQAEGLDKAVVESLPLVGYSLVKGLKGGKDLSECAVCLSDFEEDENLRLLPKCGHIFHPDCIDMWFHSHSTCPLCRSSLIPAEGGKGVEGGEDNSATSEEYQNWISSRGVGPDGEAFTIHEGPPLPPNGSILELLSRDGADRMLAESVRITEERADQLDAGLARREGEDENAERAASIRALNRALSRNSASFRNAARGLDASDRIEATSSSSARFNSSSVSISIPDLNEAGSKSFNSSQSFNVALRRSSSVGSSGRYIKQLLGAQGYGNYSPDEFGLDRARLLNSQQELPVVNPSVRREGSAQELRLPIWHDIDLNAPIGGGGEGNGTVLPSPSSASTTTRPGVLPFDRWANRSKRSGELTGIGSNYDVKRVEPSWGEASAGESGFVRMRKETEPIVEERTKSDRWSSIGQSFRRTFSLKRTSSNVSDVESSSQQQGNNNKLFSNNIQMATQQQPGGASVSKPKKFSPWVGAMKIRRQSSNSWDLPSPPSAASSVAFPPTLPATDFPQSISVDSPRSLPAISTAYPHQTLPVSTNEQQQRQQPKEDSIQIETQP